MKKVFSFILTLVVLSTVFISANYPVYATPSSVIQTYRNNIITYATGAIGSPYTTDKDLRLGPDEYDCSGLAYRAYQHAGLAITSNSAADQAKELTVSGRLSSYATRTKGDLIFYYLHPTPNNRYLNIDHVAICAGSGWIIDAGNPGVTKRVDTTFSSSNVKATTVPSY